MGVRILQAYIGVEGFGKIKKAEINISNYTIFVGNNNSGKTYLMQLIYGVINEICSGRGFHKYMDLEYDKGFVLNIADMPKLVAAINRWLDENKSSIVKSIFHSDIKISKIYLSVNNIIHSYKLQEINSEALPILPEDNDKRKFYEIQRAGQRISSFFIDDLKHEEKRILLGFFLATVMTDILSETHVPVTRNKCIFLPASRSGLMLLYSNFFSINKSEDMEIVDNTVNTQENEFGLTTPVYDFLLFLQGYRTSELRAKGNQKLIKFINDHLIDGKLNKSGNTMFYTPHGSDTHIPIYLSSSMINELTPIVQVLSGISDFPFIFYDEVETCLHPLKQIEMARLLNRLVNGGKKIIISTHSDTMAAAINNFIILSIMKSENKKNILKKLGYEEDDLLKANHVHIYQFINDGRDTYVTELESNTSIGLGYDFELFNKSNDKIYTDAKEILGVE